ncbi:hypothetical protein BDV59DRAFT_207993 [Aspergillus ambiguus]|uniref:protein GbpA n=1 Tax=Aspergillus ambiguus TaxID=176160 RepID=UPI003CCCFF2F
MDCSVSRHPSARFPFILTGFWSPSRSEQAVLSKSPAPSHRDVAPSADSAGQLKLCREVAHREVAEELENLVGHENIKRQLNGVQSWVQICRRHGRDPRDEWYNIAFEGNPGTGKSTVARIYAKMLFSIGISESLTVRETSGKELLAKGPDGIRDLLNTMLCSNLTEISTAGILVVDDPHHISESSHSERAQETLNCILEAMERRAGRVVFIFIGQRPMMEKFLCECPRFREKICSTLHFGDFERRDLLKLLWRQINQEYRGRMEIEGGWESPYMRVVARRLARGRGKDGFTNAHAVRDLIATIARRQAEYLMEQQDNGKHDVDYFFLSRYDLLGPGPAVIQGRSKAWLELQQLVGQEALKASIRELLELVEENYQREINGQRRLVVRMNRVFLGPRGTEKTRAARLYAKVLADVGLLSNGDVTVESLSSMISQVGLTGSTKAKTLIVRVDEAILERDSDSNVVNHSLGTFIQEMMEHQEGRCVILIGPTNAIGHVLPVLRKQLDILDNQIVHFDSFNLEQLQQIFQAKLQMLEIRMTPEAFAAALDILDSIRLRKDFDNCDAVDRLLNAANRAFEGRKYRCRQSASVLERVLQASDFTCEGLAARPTTYSRNEMLRSLVPEEIVNLLGRYYNEMKAACLQGRDPTSRAARTFVLKGACGISKRSVAQHIGTIYYDVGILDTDNLIEYSVLDFVTSGLGQSSLTRQLLGSARGKTMLITDAHRLGENEYTAMAINELVYLLPKYSPQMVVIMAGPSQEMDCLLGNNPRLSSQFQEEITIRAPTPHECLRILDRLLREESISGERPFLTDPQNASYREFTRAFDVLSMFPCWDSFRDIDTLRRWMVSASMQDVPLHGKCLLSLHLKEDQAMQCMVKLYNLKRDRLRFNPDSKARALPRSLSQPRIATQAPVRFPV